MLTQVTVLHSPSSPHTLPPHPPTPRPALQPYDTSAIPAIEKAIMQSDLGLTPNNDGRVIRLQVPQLTAVGPWVQGAVPAPTHACAKS